MVAALGLWLWKQTGESTEPDGPGPGKTSDSYRSGPHADHLALHADSPSSPPPQSGMPVGSAINAFEDWMARYFNADPAERDQLVEEGVTLAQRRRSELKSLIQVDPEAALAAALPYELRRELPAAIIEHLETPLSDHASYDLLVYCLGPDHSEEGYERMATIGDSRYEVFTYGRRLNVTTKERLSLHGMAIDAFLAMGEDPVRVLSEAERLDRGFSSPRVVAVGNDYYEWADVAALNRLRQLLRQDEGALGPRPGPLHWDLPGGEVEGISLLSMEDTSDWLDRNELPILASPLTEGSKTMLYIRARFSDQEADHEPIDLNTLKERQAGCEAFWHENSYGKSSLTTTFTDTIKLPNPASYYADLESDQLKALFQDAIPLARAEGRDKGQDWNEDNYDFVTLITSGGEFGYGGKAYVGAPGCHLNGAGASRVRTASHEFGHNLRLRHANYWFSDSTSPIGRDSIPEGYVGDEEGDEWIEYGHRFSVMSGQRGSGDLNEGRSHYTTGEKVKLDWLVSGDGDWVSVSRTTATPIRLYRQDVESEDLADRLRRVARAIKIDRDSGDYAATDKRRYWLSYRLLPTNGVAENWLPYGLQVDWQRETYGEDGSIQLDMTPYTRDDPLEEVETRVDNRDKEDHFTPIAQGGENPNEWIDVLVNIGSQKENRDPNITSFTASSTTVERNEVVDFLVDAEDADGDTLYYTWTFGDNSMVVDSLNSNNASKSWNDNDVFTVRVTVSDGKGGSDAKEIHVGVGDVSRFLAIKGRVIAGGFPVQDARVNIGNREQAWTDGDGLYVLPSISARENRLTAAKMGMNFEPLFSNPVLLPEDDDGLGRDWVAIGHGPASGSLQLAVTPYETEIPIRSQIEFRALAWDASGERIEPDPVWSVSGGGTISESGLFTATEAGGPFWIRATKGSSQAHALIGVSDSQLTYFELFMDNFPTIAMEDRGHDADPDGDRRTNLTEYALGGVPDVSDTYYQLGLRYELVQEADELYAEFRFPRRQDAALRGLRYEFQVSDDLSTDSWMDRGYTVLEINPIDEIFEEVRLRIDQPLSSLDPGLFGRVKIYLDE
ncbi:MAG: PKD domain-containing protein [Opitutae bacterium]|nr:PKD domain-containing protein [Opitutae bacterium]